MCRLRLQLNSAIMPTIWCENNASLVLQANITRGMLILKETHDHLLKQLVLMASEGQFGDSVKNAQKKYDQLPPGVATILVFVLDFCEELSQQNDELARIRNLSCQLLIVAYREAKKHNATIAHSLVNSFTLDYPGVPESSLLTRWCSLAHASLAFREVAHSQNRLLV